MDVGKQTEPIKKMNCPACDSLNTELRLPRESTVKKSKFICLNCGFMEYFP